MPIRPENKDRYPKDWQQIRSRILVRAKNCCEVCGVENHAVGYRENGGIFVRLCGNGPCDAAGRGKAWPSWTPLAYADAMEFVEQYNDHVGGVDGDGNHWIVIVLTVAHLDHTPENNEPSNLMALCQRCHNRYDQESRRAGRIARKELPLLFAGGCHV